MLNLVQRLQSRSGYHNARRARGALTAAVAALLLAAPGDAANIARYEPGVDPGVGFNLVSWWNYSNGAEVWQNAVQAVYDAGFTEVSLSPLRFVETSTSAAMPAGSIAGTSSRGPELSHVAAGIVRAKSLGMRVTVNPFIELKNGNNFFQNALNSNSWRGFYDPMPGSAAWTRFWADYQQYLVDVAQMANANGADSMTVGTELRALVRNSGNNASWNGVLNAVDAAFPSGTIGYAANWDNYNNTNLTTAIWDHPAVDFLGIDSYFTNLLSNAQADASGIYPNFGFITAVENAWNAKLDNEILPFAAARQGNTGLPVEFTEIGYLPRNRTTVSPQGESQPLDDDEQTMAFEGLMRALDGRLASGEFLAAHVWQWDMPGSAGSAWNMNPAGGNQPSNQQTAAWLSSFVSDVDDADFNGDGAVDGSDLLAWQRGVGGTSAGDANGDGAVNGLDLAIWQSQYGVAIPALGAGLAVPEPMSILPLTLAALAAAATSRQRHRIGGLFLRAA